MLGCGRQPDTDFHNGFGVMVMGHAHPTIAAAIAAAAGRGTHFAAPGESAIRVARELSRRFRLPKVRFANSCTEATLDAIRLGRLQRPRRRGQDRGLLPRPPRHGDGVGGARPTKMGSRSTPNRVPTALAFPRPTSTLVTVVPFNDADALDAALVANPGVGTMIMEPVMLNIGVVPPLPGYLRRFARSPHATAWYSSSTR